jgi:16S rRNA G1207 methylase RsmC
VFSHGRLDAGTKILLSDAPPPPGSGTFLDLGCGAGPIALSLARRSPDARVWAVDVNERARSLTADNARQLGLANVRVAAPDEVPTDIRFDLIWSNPPIKVGKNELHRMLMQWLTRLSEHGCAVLVVNKHLGSDSLASWLVAQGFTVARLGSRRGYRLLEVRPHHAAAD